MVSFASAALKPKLACEASGPTTVCRPVRHSLHPEKCCYIIFDLFTFPSTHTSAVAKHISPEWIPDLGVVSICSLRSVKGINSSV